jgi:methyl-galactoside transport system ATP-binding protein
MENNTYILEIKNMSKEFPGVQALDDVSVQIRPGTVHALMGENGAGKSTLMKCLFGIYDPDSGQIVLDGKEQHFVNSRQALDAGIAMVHQELLPVPYRSVMDNLWLGRYPKKGFGPFKFVDQKKMYQDTVDLFATLNIDIDPKVWVKNLSVSKVQLLEIAKAVSWGTKVIIMDEPTSSLTENEVDRLFEIIHRLRNNGVSIIYISHKIEEILAISDDVSIMRDGKHVGTFDARKLTTDQIIKLMVGREIVSAKELEERHQNENDKWEKVASLRYPIRENFPARVIFEVQDFTSAQSNSFKNVNFTLRSGEILGLGGLVGAQRTELVESLFGLRPIESGKIFIHGKEVKINHPYEAKRHKMALLTEERRATGIIPLLSVKDNMLLANLTHYIGAAGLINEKKGDKDTENMIKTLRVKTPSVRNKIKDLSGGNQQKVLFARWLLTDPEILILDEPTRGIDVGAKFEIYTIIADLAKRGKAIIMISSEMPELIGMSDRIMVMSEGRVTGFVEGENATQEEIMRLAAQYV